MYDGSHKINLLCAVTVDNATDDKLPDMKIKDETLKYLSSMKKSSDDAER